MWSASIVADLAVSALAWLPRGVPAPAVSDVLLGWNRWDARHYVEIAVDGYDLGPGYPAFFPLYPLLIRAFDPVLPGSAIVTAVIIAHISALGALIVLHRLTSYEFGHQVAQRAIFYLAAFPTGFFLLQTISTVLEAGTVLVAVVLLTLCVWGPWRFRRDQLYLTTYSALVLILLMSTAATPGRALQSSARYTLEAVAIFLVLARIGANHLADRAIS